MSNLDTQIGAAVAAACFAAGLPTKSREPRMTRIKRWLGFAAVIGILSLVSAGTANAATLSGFRPKPQPADCPKNPDGTWKYRCLDPDDYAQMTIIKINLEEEIAKLKAGNRHFGLGCAIGPGLGLVVDENLKARLVPSDLSATCGAAVKF